MLRHLRSIALLTALTLLIAAVAYPLAVLAVGQIAFAHTANASIVAGPDGKPVGSSQIAQEFKSDEWFRPRPSGVSYNAAGSGGSNLGANNPNLRKRVEDELANLPTDAGPIPADAVSTSGSGLDPHITVTNARLQLPRVVAAWAAKAKLDPARVRTTVEAVLSEAAFAPLAGLAGGEPLVNVLEVNLELVRRLARTQ